jgi:hypothetical protein
MTASRSFLDLHRPALPRGWGLTAGRLTRTESPMPDPIPPTVPPKPPENAPPKGPACAKCGAGLMTEPPAKFCAQCGEPVQMPADGEPSPEQARALGRHVLALTGAKSPDAARGTLDAWSRSAGSLAIAQKDAAEAKDQLESIERVKLLEDGIAAGTIDPALAWSFSVDDKGNKTRAFSAWAGPPNASGEGQSIAQLRAFLSASTPRPGATERTKLTATAQGLTAEQLAHAKRIGVSPELYAERLSLQESK